MCSGGYLNELAEDMEITSFQDKTPSVEGYVRAVLYGNAVGDAIGLLTEFLSKDEAKEVRSKEF